MTITSFELWKVGTDYVTADLIIWKRYMNAAPGMVEAMLDANPQLAIVHQVTPFIPAGTYVRVPIDLSLIAGTPKSLPQDALWTDKQGYSL